MTNDDLIRVLADKYPTLERRVNSGLFQPEALAELRCLLSDQLLAAATVLRKRAADWRIRESVGGNATEAGRVVTDADAAADDLVELARVMRGT